MVSKTFAIAGLGSVGSFVASRVESISGLTLTAVADGNEDEARLKLSSLGLSAKIVPAEDLAKEADIVLEALPASCAMPLYQSVIARGKTLVALSTGVLLRNYSLVEDARQTGAKIVVPSGAVGGLDALKAAREGQLRSVKMITTKPPQGLAGAPYLVSAGISLDGLSEPLLVFEGNAIEAAKAFPANVNVAAAVSLAGLGGELTRIEVWADPAASQNSHRILVRSDSSDFEIALCNFPSASNPKTSMLASLSVLATLRQLAEVCTVGT